MSLAGALALFAALATFAVAILTAMAFFFAQITGWRRLARAHPASGRPGGPRYRLEGAVLGAWGWSAPPLTLGFDDEGLDLRARPPFGFVFRPVRLPWSAIEGVSHREMMFFEQLELRYASGRTGTIGLVGPRPLLLAIEDRRAHAEGEPRLLTPSAV